MPGQGTVVLTWGDDDHVFNLARIGMLRELQTKLDSGPVEVFDRLRARQWRVDDVREVLRLGLIGGGMGEIEALRLVRAYVDDRPLLPQVPFAEAVLLAALVGVPEEVPGKKPRRRTSKRQAGASTSPPSTATAPP